MIIAIGRPVNWAVLAIWSWHEQPHMGCITSYACTLNTTAWWKNLKLHTLTKLVCELLV